MHKNFIRLQNLTLPLPMENRSKIERVLNFHLTTLNGRTPFEPLAANLVSLGEGMYMFTMTLCIFINFIFVLMSHFNELA